jgi:hypothetical protein
MEFGSDQIQAFRFWIQGYPNSCEPIVDEYFRAAGYSVLRRPALVLHPDIAEEIHAILSNTDPFDHDLEEQGDIEVRGQGYQGW